MKDIIIIGAGAVGCALARELSLYELNVLVLEKEWDVGAGTSGRNSAVVHAGFNNRPGSLMARLCVEGNRQMEALCAELDVPYQKTGKILTAFDEEDLEVLKGLVRQGEKNGCQGLRLIGQEELRRMLPGVGGIGGMLSPETAVLDPFKYCVALAENAAENGAEFRFGEEVTGIRRGEDCFTVTTPKESYSCRFLINAAGLYADKVAAMAGIEGYTLYPCRGEYLILDEIADEYLTMPVYPAPKKGIGGLGVHLTPTVHGNIIIGPSAEYIGEPDDTASTAQVMDQLWREAQMLLPTLSRKMVIGSYSGIRAKQAPPSEGGFRDFVIRWEEDCPGLIDLIGIESPGLTASMPIARMIRGMLAEKMPLKPKTGAVRKHRFPPRFAELSEKEQEALIRKDPRYGEIVCRCRRVTKKEICDAIKNPLGVKTVAGIKYRTFATTGRCNGGYCLNRIVDTLVREYGLRPEEVTLRGPGSEFFSGEVK